MDRKDFPSWSTFKNWGDFYTEEESDFLVAVYNNLDRRTWAWITQNYDHEQTFLEAIGRFAYSFVKFQNDGKELFDPLKWFKLQHQLANEIKKAAENINLNEGINIIDNFEKEYERKIVFNTKYNHPDYYKTLKRDYCYLRGEYELCWEFHKTIEWTHSIADIWKYLKHISPKPLNAGVISAALDKQSLGLTDWGFENYELVESMVNEKLQNYFNKHDNNPLFTLLKNNVSHDKSMTNYLFFNEPWFRKSGVETRVNVDYVVWNWEMINKCKELFRSAENEVRVQKGVPKIGEGWITETELYYKIKETYTDFKVLQHARPNWLNGQHFDIYLPEINVAIEYHGKQHFEPVEYFGGIEAFEEQKKRDKRKMKLAGENGCKLIIVEGGYNFEKLKDKLDEVLVN